MKKTVILKGLGRALIAAVLAAELAVLVDTAIVLNGTALSVPKFAALLGIMFLLVCLLPVPSWKGKKRITLLVTLLIGIPLVAGFVCWNNVSKAAVYYDSDNGKTSLYADKRVMLLVPHQDDDINVLGGVMEEYVKYGSEVYVVFSTNGDYYGLAETRTREALNALGNIGIPEDHIICLGYGDQWLPEGPHIYNGYSGEVLTSVFGATQTYGTKAISAYREGNDYTLDQFLSDIESVILEYMPDTIYCVDYDYQIDHRALSHSVEKVLGKILKENTDYRPVIFKGYSYNTAWESAADFYAENIQSVQNVFEEPFLQQPAVYRWEERIRLPVNPANLSRSLVSAGSYVSLAMYDSQEAELHGMQVINGDKVFWQRDVMSLCYDAQIQATSGTAAYLNDFMLLECFDLLDEDRKPFDGTWIPEQWDGEGTVTVTFPEPRDVTEIVLYDHPDDYHNVLNAVIAFDDGTALETGPLDPKGAASRFPVERKLVSSFMVTLQETQGEAGLTELEAYGVNRSAVPEFIKLMDQDGNFVYDYWIDLSGTQTFALYTGGNAPEAGENAYTVSCAGAGCSARWEEDALLVSCPEGKTCVITITEKNGDLSDTVYIQNPGKQERNWITFFLKIEEQIMTLCKEKLIHERLFVCRLYKKLPAVLNRIF